MAIDPNAALELLNAIEYLLIENAVYESSIKTIQRLLSDVLPLETFESVQKEVRAAQSDPVIRERVRGTLASLRAQLQTELNQESVIEALLQALPTKKGPVN